MGRKIKPGLHLEFEFEEGYAATGFAHEMTMAIDTDWYMNDLIHFTHAVMAKEFDSVAAVEAMASNGLNLSHVYEPGYNGIQAMQLWEHKLYGKGKEQQASFEWKLSKMPIVKPMDRRSDPNDPMSEVPVEIVQELSTEDYVFRMRAPMMEYGLKAVVTPKNTKFLFIPSYKTRWFRDRKNGTSQAGNFRFEKYNLPDYSYRNPQDPSGSDGTVGNFTATWVGYWEGGGADQVWNTQVAPMVNRGMKEAEAYIGRAARTVKKKRKGSQTFTMSTFADAQAAMESGRNLALAFIKGQAQSYRQAAKYVERHGYFGEGGY